MRLMCSADQVLFDSSELKKLPFVGDMVRERIESIPQARSQRISEEMQEEFIAPVGYPRTPNRLYVKFGKPISTTEMKEVMKDDEKCQELYSHVKAEVEDGMQYLLKKREVRSFVHFLYT